MTRGLMLTVAALAWMAQPLRAEEALNGEPVEPLTIVFSETGYLGVNRADVQAGFKALAEAVGRQRGYRVITTAKSARTARDIEAILDADESARLVAVNAWVFLDLNLSRLTPMFIGAVEGGIGRTYVLVTRRDSGLDSPADLRGRDLVVFELANAALGRYWIKTLVAEIEPGNPAPFFARTEYVLRPSAAVLPVFFGRKAACVVDRTGFDLMVEMNPQVGRELQVIAESDILVDSVLCLRNDPWPEGTYREDLIEVLRDFHLLPAGAQMLLIFKTDRLFYYREDLLDSARELRAAYQRLQERNAP